jgi:DUF4097 and DUF4098 domain-containing protein YvlB
MSDGGTMNQGRNFAVGTGTLLATFCGFLLAIPAHAAGHPGSLSEEFHQTYPMSPGGRVELDNINGAVHITGWDRNEVKVDAIKYANSQQRLQEAKIEVDARTSEISIRTQYPGHTHSFSDGDGDNPATVEYTLSVPRSANLDEIKLVNGPLDIQGVAAEVRASCVNGHLSAHNLAGRTQLSTVNGRVEADFGQVGQSPIELSSVNGSLELTLPSDAKAEIEASTVSGGIDDDFGLHVSRHQFIGHRLRGSLGGGGTRIKLSDVNGRIEIRHANDGHALSPARDLDHPDHDDDDEI